MRCSVAGATGGLPSRPSAISEMNAARSSGPTASGSSPCRERNSPNCCRSERYASSVLRDSPRSSSRYARKSSVSSVRSDRRGGSLGGGHRDGIRAPPRRSSSQRGGGWPARAARSATWSRRTRRSRRQARSSGHGTISIRSSSSGSAPARRIGQLSRQEQPHPLVGEPGARVERQISSHLRRLLADLLGELALGGLERRLAGHVELAGRDLRARRQRRRPRAAGASARRASSSSARIPTAPGCQTFSRVTSAPSACR